MFYSSSLKTYMRQRKTGTVKTVVSVPHGGFRIDAAPATTAAGCLARDHFVPDKLAVRGTPCAP